MLLLGGICGLIEIWTDPRVNFHLILYALEMSSTSCKLTNVSQAEIFDLSST